MLIVENADSFALENLFIITHLMQILCPFHRLLLLYHMITHVAKHKYQHSMTFVLAHDLHMYLYFSFM